MTILLDLDLFEVLSKGSPNIQYYCEPSTPQN